MYSFITDLAIKIINLRSIMYSLCNKYENKLSVGVIKIKKKNEAKNTAMCETLFCIPSFCPLREKFSQVKENKKFSHW